MGGLPTDTSTNTARTGRPPQRFRRWLQDDKSSWLLAVFRRIELPERFRRGPLGRCPNFWLSPEERRELSSSQLGVRATLIAAAASIGGLLFAVGGHFVEAYLQTGLVWFAVVGIGWVAFWGAWADQRLRRLQVDIQPSFADATAYNKTYGENLSRVYRRLWPTVLSICLAALLWGYVAWGMFHRGTFTVLPPSWTASHKWLHTLALWWLLVPSSALTATMLKGARDYGNLVRCLAKDALALPTELARLRLRPLVGWGIATGFGWTFGLSLLIFVFRFVPTGRGGTPHGAGLVAPIAFMTFAALWGAYYLVFLPQFELHTALQGAKIRLLQACANVMWPSAPISVDASEQATEHLKGLLEPQRDDAERIMRELTTEPEWIYPAPGELLLFATQAILPLIAFVVSLGVRG